MMKQPFNPTGRLLFSLVKIKSDLGYDVVSNLAKINDVKLQASSVTNKYLHKIVLTQKKMTG